MVKLFHINWERNGQILGKNDHDKNIYISTELAIFLNHQQCFLGIIQQSLKFNTSPLKAMMFVRYLPVGLVTVQGASTVELGESNT